MKASKTDISEKSSKAIKMSRLIPDHPYDPDISATGVELVPLKDKQPVTGTNKIQIKEGAAKDPLLSVDTHSSRPWHSTPSSSGSGEVHGVQRQASGGEWGDVLDIMSHRKIIALAPENIENMWAKGRNFKNNVSNIEQVPQRSGNGTYLGKGDHVRTDPQQLKKSDKFDLENNSVREKRTSETNGHKSTDYLIKNQFKHSINSEDAESRGTCGSQYTSEDEEADTVTGLDSPEIKVWDSKMNTNFSVDYIHHPLEGLDVPSTGKSVKGHASRNHSGRKYKVSSKKSPLWKEVQRTSILSGDGLDILNPTGHEKNDLSSDELEYESLGRLKSNLNASSSMSVRETQNASANHVENALLADAFLRLRCEVASIMIIAIRTCIAVKM